MAKKELGVLQINVHPNAVTARGKNREITIIKQKPRKEKFAADNVIFIKSLSAESGYNPGVTHEMSINGKIKLSTIGLSIEGLIELHACIGQYIKGLSNNTINHKKDTDV